MVCEATMSYGSVLVGAFVKVLGGFDPCRNGRKNRENGLKRKDTHTYTKNSKRHSATQEQIWFRGYIMTR